MTSAMSPTTAATDGHDTATDTDPVTAARRRLTGRRPGGCRAMPRSRGCAPRSCGTEHSSGSPSSATRRHREARRGWRCHGCAGRHTRPRRQATVGIGSFGSLRTLARRRRRSGIIERISSSLPKHSSRSPASSTTPLRGFGITRRAAVQGEHGDVALPEAGVADRLADDVGVAVHEQLGDAVARRDAEALAHVDLGEGDLVGDVVDDGAGDVELRRRLDALEPGEELTSMTSGPSSPSSMSTPATLQAHDLRRAHRGLLVLRRQLDPLDGAAAVHVRAELVAAARVRRIAATTRSPTTRARMSRPRLSLTKCWMSTFCFVAVQRLDDRLGDLHLGREDDADALRALEQLDDDRRPADALDRRDARRRGCARTSSPACRCCGGRGSASPAACRGRSRCRSRCSACRRPSARTGARRRCRSR